MNSLWSRSVLPIALLFSFRMLGLFMLIPVFTVLAPQLNAATPTLIGIALGCYGLTQGLLQLPFGLLSDKYGRKRIITLGLLLFALGSALGAVTDSIYGMIIARALQGTGAIGSVLIALLADLTPDDMRTKAMAVIGATIGLSFTLAMVLSPAITHLTGLPGIFYLSVILAVIGLFILHKVIPDTTHEQHNPPTWKIFVSLLHHPELMRLNIGIFFQHLILTSTFFVIPLLLQQQVNKGLLNAQWHFYLPMMTLSFLLMVPLIVFAERKNRVSMLFLSAIAGLFITQIGLSFISERPVALWGLMLVYFIAFNALEAMLPSLISKKAPAHVKGTAMGIYSSCQFLGIFIGGLLSGLLYQFVGMYSIFVFNTCIALLWFGISVRMDLSKKARISV